MREIYIDAELDLIDTANYFPRLARKDYQLAVDVATGGLDDPDQKFYENYACGAERNYTGYCDPETDRLIDAQSMEVGPRRSGERSCGRSSGVWRRTARGRCCSIRALPTASSPASRIW